MKKLIPILSGLALVSCNSVQQPKADAMQTASATRRVPRLSIVHVSGKITSAPEKSKWPSSVKVGASFDYWAVIDNSVKDAEPKASQGSYVQKQWPSRYDLRIGDFRFSSDQISSPAFGATIYHGLRPNDDGYNFHPLYHTTIPEAPELHAISFHVNLKTQRRDIVTSDKLPIHPIKIEELNGGNNAHFVGVAVLKADGSDHTIKGDVEKFEVFQASQEAARPIK